MTIVVTGGGSGGHITPILAVASELKRRQPAIRIVYIGQKGDRFGDIPAHDPNIDAVFAVRAGKFRRYHGEGFKQLLDVVTTYKNLRDAVYVLIGIYQSWRLLALVQPAAVFTRGGFVSVPVALGARFHHIPYITHDSDLVPSLANRLIASGAQYNAVALPKELYGYPANKTVTTGIPLAENFRPLTTALRRQYRQELAVPTAAKMLFIIGGGLGSQRVNKAVAEAIPHLLGEFRNLYVAHVVGQANEAQMQAYYTENISVAEQGRVDVFGFMPDVYRYSGAADLVITRAGATTLAEIAVQGKACIVVPSPFLSGGHQLKNAQILVDKHAAVVMNEVDLQADPNRLAKQVSSLLRQPKKLQALGNNLLQFAKPHATEELADLLLKIVDTPISKSEAE